MKVGNNAVGKWQDIYVHICKNTTRHIIQINIHQLDLEAFMPFIEIAISKLKYCHKQ